MVISCYEWVMGERLAGRPGAAEIHGEIAHQGPGRTPGGPPPPPATATGTRPARYAALPHRARYRHSGRGAPITAYGLGALGKCTRRARST
ncbi:hypothetical protein Sm713_19700 [Streptomyces sp. TS71-3]|nr:hypothetical protein Sm713_19700 [Streptomyces sp. TS71-3]